MLYSAKKLRQSRAKRPFLALEKEETQSVSGEAAIASLEKAKKRDSDAIAASHVLKRSKIATASRIVTFSCFENVENGDGLARGGHEDGKNGERHARNGLLDKLQNGDSLARSDLFFWPGIPRSLLVT